MNRWFITVPYGTGLGGVCCLSHILRKWVTGDGWWWDVSPGGCGNGKIRSGIKECHSSLGQSMLLSGWLLLRASLKVMPIFFSFHCFHNMDTTHHWLVEVVIGTWIKRYPHLSCIWSDSCGMSNALWTQRLIKHIAAFSSCVLLILFN